MDLSVSAKQLLAGILTLCPLALFGSTTASDASKTVAVSAKRFAYEPSEITLRRGEPVIIELTTQDVAHGLKFKELNLNARIDKGKTAELAFTPTQTGDFVGHCSVFCGSGHGTMTLTLHVTN